MKGLTPDGIPLPITLSHHYHPRHKKRNSGKNGKSGNASGKSIQTLHCGTSPTHIQYVAISSLEENEIAAKTAKVLGTLCRSTPPGNISGNNSGNISGKNGKVAACLRIVQTLNIPAFSQVSAHTNRKSRQKRQRFRQ